MTEESLQKGTLKVTSRGKLTLACKSPKGKELRVSVPGDQLSQSLGQRKLKELDGQAVQFIWAGTNRPGQIRPKGEDWQPPGPAPEQQRRRPATSSRRDAPSAAPGFRGKGKFEELPDQRFHNPYNFVPAAPRPKRGTDLDDRHPNGHHRYHPGRFSGWVDVEFETVTPLLLPDASRATELDNGHKVFPLRVDSRGFPLIPPTSVKGMLRSAFEAVTNSRLSIFSAHGNPLAYRMAAQEGLKLVPARIHGEKIHLLPGTASLPRAGSDPLHAAWLERYTRSAPNWGGLDRHGRRVWAYLSLWQHPIGRRGSFRFWNVVELRPGDDPRPAHQPADGRRPWKGARPVQPPAGRWVNGYVCISEKNIDNKHDERVFFSSKPVSPLTLVDGLRNEWRTLIDNYHNEHREELRREMPSPPALDRSVWSRHIRDATQVRELQDGDLCYARLSGPASDLRVEALYPVNVSRELFPVSPEELLSDEDLRPARRLEHLSPADRVFGWVRADGVGAHRGQLRVGKVHCGASSPSSAIASFAPGGVGLAILGAPKPQQARFYVARTPAGEAQHDGIDKEAAGYSPGKGLRGRKMYPHHRGVPERPAYWADPTRSASPQDGWHREYQREERDDQNRSVLAWVPPQVPFSFRIQVTNLSGVELGALFWLLNLGEGYFHRLGAAKPLGFGSVRIRLSDYDLLDGAAWKNYYARLGQPTSAAGQRVAHVGPELQAVRGEAMIAEFRKAIESTYDLPFEQVPVIRAFLHAASGAVDELPVHYPRLASPDGDTAPRPEGENFRWFVANESASRRSLPDPFSSRADGPPRTTLPFYRERPRRK